MRRIVMILLVLASIVVGAAGTGIMVWSTVPHGVTWPIGIPEHDGNLL